MCARNDSSCTPRPSGPVRKWSSPVSPTARTTGSAASASISARAASSVAGVGEQRRLVRVQRDAGHQLVVPPRRLHRPPRRPGGRSRSGRSAVRRRRPRRPARRRPRASPRAGRRCRGGSASRPPAPGAVPGPVAAREVRRPGPRAPGWARRGSRLLGLLDAREQRLALGDRRPGRQLAPSARVLHPLASASGPSVTSAPSDSQRIVLAFGITGCSSTATTRSASAGGVQDAVEVARRRVSSFATSHGSCSVT